MEVTQDENSPDRAVTEEDFPPHKRLTWLPPLTVFISSLWSWSAEPKMTLYVKRRPVKHRHPNHQSPKAKVWNRHASERVIAEARRMQKMLKGEEPLDWELISNLMKDTYKCRRHEIIQNKMTVPMIMYAYPALFSLTILAEEFERVTGRCYLVFMKDLSQLLQFAPAECNVTRHGTYHENYKNTSDLRNFQMECLLRNLVRSQSLEGKLYFHQNLVTSEDEAHKKVKVHSKIIEISEEEEDDDERADGGQRSYYVYNILYNNKSVCRVENFCDAVVALYFSHKVFDRKYRKPLNLIFGRFDKFPQ